MSAEAISASLADLCRALGPEEEAVLALLSRILGNIAEHPAEAKYRRLNPNSEKLKNSLLRYAEASQLLTLVGFCHAADGYLELPAGGMGTDLAKFAHEAVLQRTRQKQKPSSSHVDSKGYAVSTSSCSDVKPPAVSPEYQAALNGGAQGKGLAELGTVLQQQGGAEALQILERILDNIRRFPGNEKYRCVNLTKAAGQKVTPALPLMQVAGFDHQTSAAGEDCMQLAHANVDVLERVWAMVWWASRGHETVKELPFSGGFMSHALGAMLGAAIGDALGAPLGGRDPFQVTAEEVDKALEMCGGGIWGVAPGQATGNAELAICLADSLSEASDPVSSFPLEDLAVRYGKWGKSMPFRADRACLQVFQRPLPADNMVERAKDVNQKAGGSGALVRCIALAVLGSACNSPNKAATFADEDARLSHPSRVISHASAAYIVAAVHLIGTGGDRSTSLKELETWMDRKLGSIRSGLPLPSDDGPRGFSHLSRGAQQPMGQRSGEPEAWTPPGEELVACEETMTFLKKAFDLSKQLDFSDSSAAALLSKEVGSVEIPFAHAFRHLKVGSSFEDAMRATLAGGGDSSTNASVVGGLLGAAVGLQGIPERWIRAVLACDHSMGQHRSPEYHPSAIPRLVTSICSKPKCARR